MQYMPLVISALSLLVAVLTFVRNGSRDRRSTRKADDERFSGVKEGILKANMKLDQVCATTNETRADIKSMNKDLQNLDRRMTVVERDLKTAFSQIEELKHG